MRAVGTESRLASLLDERSVPPTELLAACVAATKARSGCLSRREGKASSTSGAAPVTAAGTTEPAAELVSPESSEDFDTDST